MKSGNKFKRIIKRSFFAVMISSFFISCTNRKADENSYLIKNVTVIEGDSSLPIENTNIVIQADTIKEISDEIDLNSFQNVIDGSGKYIIPGLWENHIHLSKVRSNALKLMVVNGITSVKDLGGEINELIRWKNQVQDGERIGPTIYMAGSYLESPSNYESMLERPVSTNVEPVRKMRRPVDGPEEAKNIVTELADLGVDLIKVRAVKDEETFIAIGQAARDHNLKLAAHTMGLSLDDILESKVKSIEHFFIPFLDEIPKEKRIEVFQKFADQEVAFAPNLTLFKDSELTQNEVIQAFLDDTANAEHPRRAYMSKYALKEWQEQLSQDRSEGRKDFFKRLLPTVIRDVKEMREAGVVILPSTDTAVVFLFPGEALIQEIIYYVELLGYTPAEALKAGAFDSAEWMGVEDRVGLIKPGFVADMVLLNKNPLENIENIKAIESVVLKGDYLDRKELDQIKESVKDNPAIKEDNFGRYVPIK